MEAHRGQVGDVVAQSSFDDDALGVVVGAEVVEADGGVGQEVPNDTKDGAGDRDQGFDLASAFDEAR